MKKFKIRLRDLWVLMFFILFLNMIHTNHFSDNLNFCWLSPILAVSELVICCVILFKATNDCISYTPIENDTVVFSKSFQICDNLHTFTLEINNAHRIQRWTSVMKFSIPAIICLGSIITLFRDILILFHF